MWSPELGFFTYSMFLSLPLYNVRMAEWSKAPDSRAQLLTLRSVSILVLI